MPSLIADIRHAIRLLRRAPGFTAVVVTTLTLGIGATTAIFSVVNALLFRPLPYDDADRLVMLWTGRPAHHVEQDWFSPMQFTDIQAQSAVFEDLALALGLTVTMTGRGTPTELGYIAVTSSFFRMLGAVPGQGRLFDDRDDRGDAPTVAILTDGLWKRAFGGDRNVLGQSIILDGTEVEIAGVLPPAFLLDNEVMPVVRAVGHLDVVLSLPFTDEMRDRRAEIYNVVGKLKPEVSLGEAQAELDVIAAGIRATRERDPNSGFFIRAVPLVDEVVGGVRQPLGVLMASVGVMLLIACANVANLLLARSSARRRELRIRAAVGAERGRLARQLLTESLVLAALGGALGVVSAYGGVSLLRRLGASSLPRLGDIGIDGWVLAFAVAATALTSVIFGIVPAWRGSDVDLTHTLKQGERSVIGGSLWSRFDISSAFVIGQVGLSVVLLIGGGLLLRTVTSLQRADPGFESERLLTFRLQLTGEEYADGERRAAFYRTVAERLENVPTVAAAGAVSLLPFGAGISWGEVGVEDFVPSGGRDQALVAEFRVATPNYFGAMGIPLVRGRVFDERDRADGQHVAIIDEQFADRFFADRDPIGRRISDWAGGWAVIVGVVGSVRHYALESDSRITRYYPHAQTPWARMFVTVKSTDDPVRLAATAVRTVHELDPNLAVVDVVPMHERLAAALAPRRFSMSVLQAFSLIALALAAVGVYGLVSYRVSLGTHDLGMRMALGASEGRVLTLVLRHGMTLALVGVATGLITAAGVTRLMGAMLHDVSPTDVTTYAAVTAGLILTTFVACWVPGRRAARLDPLIAIRAER